MILPMLPFFASEMINATLTYYASDTYNATGKLVTGVATTQTISVVYPQPLRAEELQMLTDGERIVDYVKTFTSTDVDTRVGTNPSDKITILGNVYKVVQVEKRPVGGFSKIILRRT